MLPEFWCQQTLRISVDGPDGPTSLLVEKPFALVGADARSDIVLPDQRVPNRKLYLHATPEGVFCVDLAPGRLDKQKIHGWLSPDRPVKLGPYSIRVALGDGEPVTGGKPRPQLDAKGTLPEPRPSLIARHQEKQIGRGVVTRQLSVLGRAKPSSMIIKSHAISRCHCALVWVSDECWAIDLLSANGTYLDGCPLKVAKLRPGDILVLGEGEIEVSYLPPEATTPSLEAETPGKEARSEVIESEDFVFGDEDWEAVGEQDEHVLPEPVLRPAWEAAGLREQLAEQRAFQPRQREADHAQPAAGQEAGERELTVRPDAMRAQQEELDRQAATWKAERQHEADRLAAEAKPLEEEAARLASLCPRTESERAAIHQEKELREAEANRHREQLDNQETPLKADRAALAGQQEAVEKGGRERADELHTQQADFSRQVATWEATRQREESRLADEPKRLEAEATTIAAEAARVENQRAALEAEAAERREQAALQQRQLEADRARLAGEQEAVEKGLRERRDALRTRQEDFSRQVATWEATRRREEGWLAEESKRLLEAEAAKIAAEAASLETQRACFVAEAAELRQQTALQQRQLEADRARLAGQQEAVEKGLRERADELHTQQADFRRQVTTWEAIHQGEESRLAEAAKQLEAEAAKIAAEAASLETQRAGFVAETAELREQTALQQRQLEADRARLAGQQEAVEKELRERGDALRTQQADFSRQVATWEATRQREEGWLAEESKRLLEAEAAKIAAEAASLDTQRAAFEDEMAEGTSALRVQREELSRQAAAWEGTRQHEARRLADEARRLEAEGAEIATRAAALASERAVMRQELAREPNLAPQRADGEEQRAGHAPAPAGCDQLPDEDDPLAVLRRSSQQEAEKDRYASLLALFVAATACLVALGAIIWWNYLL